MDPSKISTLNKNSKLFYGSILEASIKLVINSGFGSIHFVGFDGYDYNSIKHKISIENSNIFDIYKADLKIISLTPTKYNSLIKKSIYGG